LRIRFSKISPFGIVLKRLKLHQFIMVWHKLFLDTSIWVSEEGQQFKNVSKKMLVS